MKKQELSKDEYEILSTIIKEEIGRNFKSLIIQGNTSFHKSNNKHFDLETIITFIKKNMKSISSETLDDFNKKCLNNVEIKKLFSGLIGEIILIKEANLSIQKIRKQYPNSSGILTFSRVGFNSNYTEALVYRGFENPTMGLMGEGTYILLKHTNGWQIHEEIVSWES